MAFCHTLNHKSSFEYIYFLHIGVALSRLKKLSDDVTIQQVANGSTAFDAWLILRTSVMTFWPLHPFCVCVLGLPYKTVKSLFSSYYAPLGTNGCIISLSASAQAKTLTPFYSWIISTSSCHSWVILWLQWEAKTQHHNITMYSRESSSHWSPIIHLMRLKQPTENTIFLSSAKTGVRKQCDDTQRIPSLPGRVGVFAFLMISG